MRRVTILLALLAAVVLAAGCGSSKQAGSPAALTPAGAAFYGEGTLKPKGSQKQAVEGLIEKFPGSGPAAARVDGLLERAFSSSRSGLSFRRDIKPWLGDRAGFFVAGPVSRGRDPHAALLVKTTDEGAARRAVTKAARGRGRQLSYKGHDYTLVSKTAVGTVSGFLVTGSEGGFKSAVDAKSGKALSDSGDLDKTVSGLPSDRLGFLYVDPGKLFASAPGLGAVALAPLKNALGGPQAAAVTADDRGVQLVAPQKSSSRLLGPASGKGTPLLGDLPGDSWLALAQPQLGKSLSRYVDLFSATLGGRAVVERQLRAATGLSLQRDVLDWMGDFGVFVRGTTARSVGGALVIETTDPAASRRALAAVARLVRRRQPSAVSRLTAPGGGQGFTIRQAGLAQPLHLFQRGGRVVVAYGDAAARDATRPSGRLSHSSDFQDAATTLGQGLSVSLYVAARPLFTLIENETSDPRVARARPYIAPLEALLAGSKRQGDKVESRFRVTVR